MNKVVLVGRLTRDPEVRYTNNGDAVCNFNVAVDSPGKGGEKRTDFPRVKVFGATAENCGRYLVQGSQVAVEGRIETGKYEDRNGQTKYTTDVNASRVEFLSYEKKDGGGHVGGQPFRKTQQREPPWDNGQGQSQPQNDTPPWEQGQQQSYMPGNKGYQGWNGK